MNRDELNWQDIRLFLAVAENGSFSAAARELGLGQPTLSRRIAALEAQLGGPLFTRLSQGCELTNLGAKLLPAAEQMAQWSAEAKVQMNAPEEISGKVRITAPPAIAFAILPPFAAELAERFPDIQLEVLSSVDMLNLARGQADISLRIHLPEDEDLVCFASYYGQLKIYASAQMAKKIPDSASIRDLKWICWPENYDTMPTNQALKELIPNFVPAFTSDDYNVQLAACCSGIGVMVLPQGFDQCKFITGLTTLSIDLEGPSAGELHLVMHKRQRHLPRVEKVAELLQQHLNRFWPESSKLIRLQEKQ